MNVQYLSLKEDTPAEGYWDQELLKDIFESIPDVPGRTRHVFVIPGAYQADKIWEINLELAKHDSVLVFITSDEEGKFPLDALQHQDIFVFTQYGNGDVQGWLPLGYPLHTRTLLRNLQNPQKITDWFFSGQLQNQRRVEFAKVLDKMPGNMFNLLVTEGFSKGLKPWEYAERMAHTRTVPCPPGNVTQDSFRIYEALEAGAVPIVDRYSDQGDGMYWHKLFPDAPFPVVNSAADLPQAIRDSQALGKRNEVFAWWIRKKMEIRAKIKEFVGVNDVMTVIVPTSPIPSHPSTEIIDQTIASIRFHTGADIILTIDGVRPEQAAMQPEYERYIQKLLWKCNFEYENVYPILNNIHQHQSGMMKQALAVVKSPLVMYVEHDTPLVTDEQIDWALVSQILMKREGDLVRFHYEAVIPEPHKHLMLEPLNEQFLKTRQWSQRPHVARTDFYREVMKFFSVDANCFLEDLLYGRCLAGEWDDWRLLIYTPGTNIKRSLNLDGRGSDRKFEAEQKW